MSVAEDADCCLMEDVMQVECVLIDVNDSEAEDDKENDTGTSLGDVADAAQTSDQNRQDRTHPWPHLKNFFDLVITKVKSKVGSKDAWKRKVKCVLCKVSITYNTYSLFSLKSHYERVSKYWSAYNRVKLPSASIATV